MKNKIKPFLFILTIIGGISLAATVPQQNTQQQDWKAKNLKVLPKDISKKALDSIMHNFKDALGVKCNFCHAKSKTDSTKLDFASDENRKKNFARYMMVMTDSINNKYFKRHLERHGSFAVTCATCHRGQEEPAVTMPTTEKNMGMMPQKKGE
ncbi:c-type cytochrome [Pedobacter sp. SD-b]|uniref:Photosynthetic reaction center cytochrome c subunit n=1 Tax=Pedobacter segetis TaxID=2793069 RepID=A0ABS1BGK1_9SPHI|nr:c-type cytochrome [Pedobacter segetis]MBK0381921.1 c-type cytochrome [Pedobacter segetis]